MKLGKLLEQVYLACGLEVLRRVATGGGTTTVVDTGIINRRPDGYYAQGTNGGHLLFMAQTTDRAAPEGEFGEISSFTLSTSTPTFTVPTMTAAAGAGDVYAVMKPVLLVQEMIACINEGLRRLPEREQTNTSLTGLASTLNYSLPSPINRYNIQKIEIGNNTNGWADAPAFSIVPATGSGSDTLLFTHQPGYDKTTPTNQTIKITYRDVHPLLSVYSDSVEKNIPEELAIAVCAESAMEFVMRRNPSRFANKSRMALYQSLMAQSQKAQMEHLVRNEPARRQNRVDLGVM